MSPVILPSPAAPMERPGVGLVISSGEAEVYAGRNVAAFLGRARQGPVNRPIRCTSLSQIVRTFGGAPFGGDPSHGNTMDGAMEALRGGATAVWVVRMGGTDGVASSFTVGSIRFEALGPGRDGDLLAVSVLGQPGDPDRRIVVYQRPNAAAAGDAAIEVGILPFPGDLDPAIEQESLLTAFRNLGSDFVDISELPGPAVALPETPQTTFAGGTDPTITMADIDHAMDSLGSAPFEVLAQDFVEAAEVNLLRQKLIDWMFGGKLAMATIGTMPGQAWSVKMAAARQWNDPGCVLIGNGFLSTGHTFGSGREITGYMAAGREAGRHAALPLARQLTHAVVRDGIRTEDEPAPDIIASANAAGVYLYSTNERGAVWTEWGLTTFSNVARPPSWAVSTDLGWRKSRLVLTRFRLLTDIALALSPLIETATNNAPGRASVMAEAQAVIDDVYIPSGAVTEGIVIQHPDYPPVGERFTMLISPLTTPDGTEQLVVEARFRR